MFKSLARSVRRVDLTYFFIFLFYLVLNRVDALVCPPLEQVGFHYPWTVKQQILWWIFWAVTIYVVYRRYRRKHKILKFLSISA
jgi:hypothetical protein